MTQSDNLQERQLAWEAMHHYQTQADHLRAADRAEVERRSAKDGVDVIEAFLETAATVSCLHQLHHEYELYKEEQE